MSLFTVLFRVLVVVVLSFSLADLKRVAAYRLTLGLAWAVAIAIVLGCGYLLD